MSMIGKPANVRIVTVTPDLASEWLSRNQGNRPVNQKRVKLFTEDMQSKQWKRNGEPIIFDANGILRDGQHRLMALAASGENVEMYVVFDEQEADILTIDQGSPRSPGQGFACRGEMNATKKASAARLLRAWSSAGHFAREHLNEKISNLSLHETWKSYRVPEDFVSWSHSLKYLNGCLPPAGILAVAIVMRLDTSESQAMTFMNTLESGANLSESHPLYHLRRNIENRGIQRRVIHHQFAPQVFASWCVRAWNLWVRGASPKIWKFVESDYNDKIHFENIDFAEYK